MNVPTITMEPDVAQEKLEAYRAQLRQRADDEYEAAVAGYKALAEGKPLLNLTEAIQSGGLGADHRPRLAVARADRWQVWVETTWNPDGVRFITSQSWQMRQSHLHIPFPRESTKDMKRGYSLVPMVPADVRPNVDLAHCLILWEVLAWSSQPLTAMPDRDPFLLKHIAGDLYAVLAEWELTELERAIMATRRER